MCVTVTDTLQPDTATLSRYDVQSSHPSSGQLLCALSQSSHSSALGQLHIRRWNCQFCITTLLAVLINQFDYLRAKADV